MIQYWYYIKPINRHLLQPGAGTMRPEIISSLMTGGSLGGGGHTRLSISMSVVRRAPGARSGGSVRDERIIIHNDNSSCRTDSRYIMSRSLTIAPFITIISSPLIIPIKDNKKKRGINGWKTSARLAGIEQLVTFDEVEAFSFCPVEEYQSWLCIVRQV